MDYSTMEAGREMDAQIWRTIFEYCDCVFHRHDRFDAGKPRSTEDILVNGEVVHICIEHKKQLFPSPNIPQYSTNISAAWEVVEKMGEMKISKYAVGYRVEIFNANGDGGDCVADTAPLAICRAALMAVSKYSAHAGRGRG